MSRQPIIGLLLLSAAVTGAFATYGTRSSNSLDAGPPPQSAAPVQSARRLDAAATALARAEWEETLRTANVRLMALQRIPEQTAPPPEVIQDPSGQQVLDLSAPPVPNPTRQAAVSKLAPPAAQASKQVRPARTARKSHPMSAAIDQSTGTEPWNSSVVPTR
jgi:hypothetical protein